VSPAAGIPAPAASEDLSCPQVAGSVQLHTRAFNCTVAGHPEIRRSMRFSTACSPPSPTAGPAGPSPGLACFGRERRGPAATTSRASYTATPDATLSTTQRPGRAAFLARVRRRAIAHARVQMHARRHPPSARPVLAGSRHCRGRQPSGCRQPTSRRNRAGPHPGCARTPGAPSSVGSVQLHTRAFNCTVDGHPGIRRSMRFSTAWSPPSPPADPAGPSPGLACFGWERRGPAATTSRASYTATPDATFSTINGPEGRVPRPSSAPCNCTRGRSNARPAASPLRASRPRGLPSLSGPAAIRVPTTDQQTQSCRPTPGMRANAGDAQLGRECAIAHAGVQLHTPGAPGIAVPMRVLRPAGSLGTVHATWSPDRPSARAGVRPPSGVNGTEACARDDHRTCTT